MKVSSLFTLCKSSEGLECRLGESRGGRSGYWSEGERGSPSDMRAMTSALRGREWSRRRDRRWTPLFFCERAGRGGGRSDRGVGSRLDCRLVRSAGRSFLSTRSRPGRSRLMTSLDVEEVTTWPVLSRELVVLEVPLREESKKEREEGHKDQERKNMGKVCPRTLFFSETDICE